MIQLNKRNKEHVEVIIEELKKLRENYPDKKEWPMCGICGFIGESKKPVLTYQIITNLLEKSEIRGIDATGFWGTENGVDGSVIYHKEPIRSSDFVKKKWLEVSSKT